METILKVNEKTNYFDIRLLTNKGKNLLYLKMRNAKKYFDN